MTIKEVYEGDVVFEHRIRVHILRQWSRERIVKFATHLLGDQCQQCAAVIGETPAKQQATATVCKNKVD
jgi:hypothetical protein